MVKEMRNIKPKYYAFFDVDGTLMAGAPMKGFIKYFYNEQYYRWKLIGSLKYKLFVLKSIFSTLMGRNREYLNKQYYRNFRNQDVRWVKLLGENWYMQNAYKKSNAFLSHVVSLLIDHQKLGGEVVLVSGSFSALLEPFAKEFNINHVLSTKMKIDANAYTGDIDLPPVIGEGKAIAIRKFLAKEGFDNYQACYAYGDHQSDIPMLSLVGNPCVIAGNKELEVYAKKHNWNVL